MASVIVTPAAQREINDLPLPIRTLVGKIIERLKQWPEVSGAKPLRGNLAGHYRIRTRDYRVQCYPTGDVVTIEKVGHRDGFYDD